MKTQLFQLFSDKDSNRFDNTKTITIMTFILGWIVTLVVAFKGSPDAVYFFGVMIAAGSGLTVTKGVVDTKQKALGDPKLKIDEVHDE